MTLEREPFFSYFRSTLRPSGLRRSRPVAEIPEAAQGGVRNGRKGAHFDGRQREVPHCARCCFWYGASDETQGKHAHKIYWFRLPFLRPRPQLVPEHDYRWARMWTHRFFKDPPQNSGTDKVETLYSGTKVDVCILGTLCLNTAPFCAGAQALVFGYQVWTWP